MQYPQVYFPGHRQKNPSKGSLYFLTDSDYDYILEEIVRRDKTDFEREVDVYRDDMEDEYEHFK